MNKKSYSSLTIEEQRKTIRLSVQEIEHVNRMVREKRKNPVPPAFRDDSELEEYLRKVISREEAEVGYAMTEPEIELERRFLGREISFKEYLGMIGDLFSMMHPAK